MSKLRVLLMFSVLHLSSCDQYRVIDFFGDGVQDDSRLRYAISENTFEVDISGEFTICSSIYMKSFIMEQSLFQVLDADKRPWFSLYFLQLDEEKMTFPFSLAVKGVYRHLTQVTADPLQWNHACIAIDTATGFTTVAINDRIVFDQVFEYFVNSSSSLPRL